MNSEGSEESVLKTEKNGDYESSSKKSDAEGNLIEESTGSKKSEANGDYVEKKETKDGNGNVLESFEAAKKTDAASGTVTEIEKSVARDGSVKELEIVKGNDNKVVSFLDTETNAEGVKTDSQYSGKKDGTLTLDKMTISEEQKGLIKKLLDKLFNDDVLIIPGSIAGIDQETFIVSEIGKGAFEGQKLGAVTLPDTIVKVDTDAFKNCGITELNVTGKVTKKLFAKDSLSGCGNKSKGKGLTINVRSKRDMKQMKKLLRRAGVAKAKVKVYK